LLGAELIEVGLSDYCVDVDFSAKKLIAHVFRRVNPDIVLTHHHLDYGSDHNNRSILVRDAPLAATVSNVHAARPAIARQPAISMREPMGGFNFQPEVYVDITNAFATKLKKLA
jgi:LmbE family N-acetylglucosaminyl deacetylase